MNTNMRKTMYCKHCGHETDDLTMGYCDVCYHDMFEQIDESHDDDQAVRRAGSVTPKLRMTP